MPKPQLKQPKCVLKGPRLVCHISTESQLLNQTLHPVDDMAYILIVEILDFVDPVDIFFLVLIILLLINSISFIFVP
jgi:hypothetical protein